MPNNGGNEMHIIMERLIVDLKALFPGKEEEIENWLVHLKPEDKSFAEMLKFMSEHMKTHVFAVSETFGNLLAACKLDITDQAFTPVHFPLETVEENEKEWVVQEYCLGVEVQMKQAMVLLNELFDSNKNFRSCGVRRGLKYLASERLESGDVFRIPVWSIGKKEGNDVDFNVSPKIKFDEYEKRELTLTPVDSTIGKLDKFLVLVPAPNTTTTS